MPRLLGPGTLSSHTLSLLSRARTVNLLVCMLVFGVSDSLGIFQTRPRFLSARPFSPGFFSSLSRLCRPASPPQLCSMPHGSAFPTARGPRPVQPYVCPGGPPSLRPAQLDVCPGWQGFSLLSFPVTHPAFPRALPRSTCNICLSPSVLFLMPSVFSKTT